MRRVWHRFRVIFMSKILIVEDQEELLEMLSDKLLKEGFEVIKASDGVEGLKKAKEEKPDLMLLDIIMPKLGGMDVLEIMAADQDLSKIPVVIISNSGQQVEIGRAKALGAKDFLIKAEFDPQEVVDKVNKVLEAGSAPSEGKTLETDGKTNSDQATKEEPGKESSKETKAHSVLVVEDDQFLRDLIIKKLEEKGLKTLQAIDGEEGLRILRDEKPDIVLLDLILPGIDGFEVLKKIREDTSTYPDPPPIVILSNLGQKDDIERGLQFGAKDYLIKAHFTPGEIVDKVKEILE